MSDFRSSPLNNTALLVLLIDWFGFLLLTAVRKATASVAVPVETTPFSLMAAVCQLTSTSPV
ncbi:hypothetical protein FIQ41_20100 [Salmonella enterica subsp. enterica]|nr:hypothetical protein [Salmonella enterica subsp. enterica serovar Sandiego]ECF2357617.1 hypothetical protein [Salmonella enterica subsp. enterica serovar Brandenburg]EGV5286040.1 hypothetical protein [Salmonella enterica]ECM3412805.1 hypothetical protein [Salmonella enterica subsp. enterica serovar Brandenburg]ECP8416662.1 hypothetical protein [Salmonella enterica subsp. enterica serovar Brandenburg]